MTSSREIVLVGGVLDQLQSVGSWCGETHIQKTCYVAKVTSHIPFESEFTLYKHGPYSFDMNSTLTDMRSRNLVMLTPQGQYGVSYSLNKEFWSALNRAAGDYFAGFKDRLSEICSVLGPKNVAALERISTAIFVSVEYPDLDSINRQKKLRELKPHISEELSVKAFEEARTFIDRILPHQSAVA